MHRFNSLPFATPDIWVTTPQPCQPAGITVGVRHDQRKRVVGPALDGREGVYECEALVPVAVSAEPFTLQAVVYFPHHIEWPIAHLARVPDNVVSGEINSDTDEDCPAVRFRCPAGDSRDDCRHHQTYKSRRDKLHGTPHGVDGAIPHSLMMVSEYMGSGVESSTEPMRRRVPGQHLRAFSALYIRATYWTAADMART